MNKQHFPSRSEILAARIKAGRLAAGFSLNGFAEITETTEAQIVLIEDGTKRPTANHLILIGKALNMKISDLLR